MIKNISNQSSNISNYSGPYDQQLNSYDNVTFNSVNGVTGSSVVTLTGAQTLTNKVINSVSNTVSVSGTNINSLINQDVRNTANVSFNSAFIGISGLTFASGASVNMGNVTLNLPATMTTISSNTLTLPTITDTLVGKTTTDILTNKTFTDASVSFVNNSDNTKIFKIDCSGISTGTTRTIAIPNSGGTFVTNNATQTLTAKTLTAPIISTISNTGTLTLPTTTDTLVGRATTDTLTNKTLDTYQENNTMTRYTGSTKVMTEIPFYVVLATAGVNQSIAPFVGANSSHYMIVVTSLSIDPLLLSTYAHNIFVMSCAFDGASVFTNNGTVQNTFRNLTLSANFTMTNPSGTNLAVNVQYLGSANSNIHCSGIIQYYQIS